MALKPIIPGKPIISPAKHKAALAKAIDKTTKVALSDFKKTTKTWKRQPAFIYIAAQQAGTALEGATGTDNEIYGYVTHGTRPHIIRPRRAKRLSFQTGYRPKTRRRILGSRQGGASGAWAYAKEVHHPGTEARQFEEEIAARRQLTLEQNVLIELNKVTK